MSRRPEEKLARFQTDLGREPTERERWNLEREAVLDSRPDKRHGASLADLHHLWRIRVQVMGLPYRQLIEAALRRQRPPEGIDAARAASVADAAVASLADQQSAWRPAELVRELA